MINIKKIKSKLLKLLIVSIFLDAYDLVYIQSYPVTIFTIALSLYLIVGIADAIQNRKFAIDFSTKIAMLMIVYLIFNSVYFKAENVSSLLLALFFWTTYIFSRRNENDEISSEYINLFSRLMNVMAVYGIYQFIGRIYNLPLTDLILKNNMVTGFNWSNPISFLNGMYDRSNAIFREPSFFSQYLAINILILLDNCIESTEENKKKSIIWICINVIALVLSFSGTGILLLVVGALIYIIRSRKDVKLRRKLIGLSLAAVVILIGIINSPIGRYYIVRFSELLVYNQNEFSGYVRFRSGFDILKSAWKENFILGTGIGSVDEYIKSISNYYEGMTVNGFYRPAVELGIIGLILWLLFVLGIYKKTTNRRYLMIQCSIIPLMICHETFMSNYYWLFLIMMNFRGVDRYEKKYSD